MERASKNNLLGSSAPARLFATPVLRILSQVDDKTVGYIYEWNNGERQPMWISGRVRAVTYAPFVNAPPQFAT